MKYKKVLFYILFSTAAVALFVIVYIFFQKGDKITDNNLQEIINIQDCYNKNFGLWNSWVKQENQNLCAKLILDSISNEDTINIQSIEKYINDNLKICKNTILNNSNDLENCIGKLSEKTQVLIRLKIKKIISLEKILEDKDFDQKYSRDWYKWYGWYVSKIGSRAVNCDLLIESQPGSWQTTVYRLCALDSDVYTIKFLDEVYNNSKNSIRFLD